MIYFELPTAIRICFVFELIKSANGIPQDLMLGALFLA